MARQPGEGRDCRGSRAHALPPLAVIGEHATAFEDAVRSVLLATGRGEVLTYGEVAAEAGYPGAARAVGNYLRRTGDEVPWHRVLGAGDRIISRCADDQMRLLREEGLIIEGTRVRRHD